MKSVYVGLLAALLLLIAGGCQNDAMTPLEDNQTPTILNNHMKGSVVPPKHPITPPVTQLFLSLEIVPNVCDFSEHLDDTCNVQVTARAYDQLNRPVAGLTLYFAAQIGSLEGTGVTDAAGRVEQLWQLLWPFNWPDPLIPEYTTEIMVNVGDVYDSAMLQMRR